MKKITKQSPITLVELPPTQFGELFGRLSYDIFSKFHLPARALPTLEAVLRRDGFTNVESINPIYDNSNGIMSKKSRDRILSSDIVLASSITRTSPPTIEFARRIKTANPDITLIFGGPDPTFRPDVYLEAGDIVVIGEGEATISELMERLVSDSREIEDINGLTFKTNGKIIQTAGRKLLTSDKLSEMPVPFYNKQTREHAQAVIETSRGCPNHCDFCSVSELYGGSYRVKSIEHVLEDIKQTRDMGHATFISDDNLAGTPQRAIRLLNAISEAGLKLKYGVAQVSVSAADNDEFLEAAKKAGIRAFCIGIESINDETLKALNKPYTASKNKEAVKKIREFGFWVYGMMMPGGDGDTPESLRETSKWVNKNLDSVQLFAPIPCPGTRFHDKMEREGRILTKDWSLYDGQHVIVLPINFTPYELQTTINNMYKDFYSISRGLRRWANSPMPKIAFGITLYAAFGGLRKIIQDKQSRDHLKFLKSIS